MLKIHRLTDIIWAWHLAGYSRPRVPMNSTNTTVCQKTDICVSLPLISTCIHFLPQSIDKKKRKQARRFDNFPILLSRLTDVFHIQTSCVWFRLCSLCVRTEHLNKKNTFWRMWQVKHERLDLFFLQFRHWTDGHFSTFKSAIRYVTLVTQLR